MNIEPCPVCGNTDLHVVKEYNAAFGEVMWEIKCWCGFWGPPSDFRPEAIKFWNQKSKCYQHLKIRIAAEEERNRPEILED